MKTNGPCPSVIPRPKNSFSTMTEIETTTEIEKQQVTSIEIVTETQ
jgi:hypothetical protein